MPFRDLRDYLAALDKAGELKRIGAEVSPVLEITEIADRVVKKGGPALVFEKPAGAAMPVAINLFGSAPRVMRALEVGSWQEWTDRLDFFLEPKMPTSLLDKVRTLPKLVEVAGIFPKIVKDGPVHEVVATGDQVDLDGAPGAAVLARRRRPLPHADQRDHQGPGDRRAQLRHVPAAGLRPQHHRHALAPPPRHGADLPRQRQARPAHRGRGRARRRPGDDVRPGGAAAARRRRAALRRLRAPRAGRDGEVRDGRPRGAGDTPRSSSRARSTPTSGAARGRSATTPASTRWPTTTRSSTSPRSPTARTRSTRPPSSARRRWRTASWATPSSGCSCR